MAYFKTHGWKRISKISWSSHGRTDCACKHSQMQLNMSLLDSALSRQVSLCTHDYGTRTGCFSNRYTGGMGSVSQCQDIVAKVGGCMKGTRMGPICKMLREKPVADPYVP